MTNRLRILLADDHAILRESLRAFLDFQPDIEVVGEAADGLEAIQEALRLQPDLICSTWPCHTWVGWRLPVV